MATLELAVSLRPRCLEVGLVFGHSSDSICVATLELASLQTLRPRCLELALFMLGPSSDLSVKGARVGGWCASAIAGIGCD